MLHLIMFDDLWITGRKKISNQFEFYFYSRLNIQLSRNLTQTDNTGEASAQKLFLDFFIREHLLNPALDKAIVVLMIRSMEPIGAVRAKEKPVCTYNIHSLSGCFLASIARLRKIQINIFEIFDLLPCVRVIGKTCMGQNELEVWHLFQ